MVLGERGAEQHGAVGEVAELAVVELSSSVPACAGSTAAAPWKAVAVVVDDLEPLPGDRCDAVDLRHLVGDAGLNSPPNTLLTT